MGRWKLGYALICAAVAAVAFGCGSDSSGGGTTNMAMACPTTGLTQACPCPGTLTQGVTMCQADLTWSPCGGCPVVAAGTGGAAGMIIAGSGGVAGTVAAGTGGVAGTIAAGTGGVAGTVAAGTGGMAGSAGSAGSAAGSGGSASTAGCDNGTMCAENAIIMGSQPGFKFCGTNMGITGHTPPACSTMADCALYPGSTCTMIPVLGMGCVETCQ